MQGVAFPRLARCYCRLCWQRLLQLATRDSFLHQTNDTVSEQEWHCIYLALKPLKSPANAEAFLITTIQIILFIINCFDFMSLQCQFKLWQNEHALPATATRAGQLSGERGDILQRDTVLGSALSTVPDCLQYYIRYHRRTCSLLSIMTDDFSQIFGNLHHP